MKHCHVIIFLHLTHETQFSPLLPSPWQPPSFPTAVVNSPTTTPAAAAMETTYAPSFIHALVATPLTFTCITHLFQPPQQRSMAAPAPVPALLQQRIIFPATYQRHHHHAGSSNRHPSTIRSAAAVATLAGTYLQLQRCNMFATTPSKQRNDGKCNAIHQKT